MANDIRKIPNEAEFVVHVGYMNKARSSCYKEKHAEVRRILHTSVAPLFIIPGDNDWNNCQNPD